MELRETVVRDHHGELPRPKPTLFERITNAGARWVKPQIDVWYRASPTYIPHRLRHFTQSPARLTQNHGRKALVFSTITLLFCFGDETAQGNSRMVMRWKRYIQCLLGWQYG
jgi:hypothetical protein